MGANRWRVENEWPLARTDWQTWYLGADGSLGREQPAPGTATYVHDPHDPVPTVGGAILMAGSPAGGLDWQPGSRDQRGSTTAPTSCGSPARSCPRTSR